MVFARYLDNYEEAHLHAPTAFVVDCDSRVDEIALGCAFQLLCVQYPALRGRIHRDAHGHLLSAPAGQDPEFRVACGVNGDYPGDVAAAWDVGRSVAKLVLTRGGDGDRVAFYMDHAIGDGRNMYALLEMLWRFYADIVGRTGLSIFPALRLPAPPMRVVADRMRLARLEPEHPAGAPDAALVRLCRRRISLTERQTRALATAARGWDVSVYTLLCGVIMAAQRACLAGTEAVPMTVRCTVDLRHRVDPPVGALETTNFASAVAVSLPVSRHARPVHIGRRLRGQLAAGIARLEPHRRMLDGSTDLPGTEPEPGLTAAIVSSLGVAPVLAAADGLRIADFQIWPYGWRLRYPMYMMYTYAGRLGIDAIFRADAHDRDRVDRIVDMISDYLTSRSNANCTSHFATTAEGNDAAIRAHTAG